MTKTRRAFTLVELSIVLVIIGLILGGVLTGQQIIQNARITNTVNAVQAYQSQFQTYAQNYGVLPGDDSTAAQRFPNFTMGGTKIGSDNGNGDGFINSANESLLAWAHLRAAGLVKNQLEETANDKNTAVRPPNPFNGFFNFQNGAFKDGFTTTVLCFNNVPALAALAIDTRLDDGESFAGSVRASADNSIAPTNVIEVSQTYSGAEAYTLCTRI